jgi:hypothetical protein
MGTTTYNITQHIMSELKNYKHNLALLKIIENEPQGIQASVITGMPTSNSRNSTTEQNALCNKDAEKLTREIKTVEIWLELLDDKELFVVNQSLIHGRSYNTCVHLYYREFGIIFSQRFWKYKKRQGIERIEKLYT